MNIPVLAIQFGIVLRTYQADAMFFFGRKVLHKDDIHIAAANTDVALIDGHRVVAKLCIILRRQRFHLFGQYILNTQNLDGMVKDLPFGLNTDLNEKGIKLSGGEIRRIAVARAIYRDTPVYLFDEPTASVDRENKRLVIREIDSLRRRNKSVVVVTHDIEAFYRYGAGIDKIIRIFRDKTSAHSAVEVCTPESQIF